MEDNLLFSKMEDNLLFSKMEGNLLFSKIEDDLNSFKWKTSSIIWKMEGDLNL
jgi:hypothetical protein